jgi:hypothetical protein
MTATAGHRLTLDPMGKYSNAFFSETTNMIKAKFVSDLQQVSGFVRGPPVSSTNKTDCHNITEILLKVALSTIKPSQLFVT